MSRAERRSKSKSKHKRRIRDWLSYDTNRAFGDNPRHVGHLKDGHNGCGCGLCSPHKFTGEAKMTLAERKAQARELEYRYIGNDE